MNTDTAREDTQGGTMGSEVGSDTGSDRETDSQMSTDSGVRSDTNSDSDRTGATETVGSTDDGETRITDSTGTVFVHDCGSSACTWVPENPEGVQPECVDAFVTMEGELLLICGVVIVSESTTSVPLGQCRPVICQAAADCPASNESESFRCESGVCRNTDPDRYTYQAMELPALCANELQRENECGMVWSNQTYLDRVSARSETCPDPESEECTFPEGCLQP